MNRRLFNKVLLLPLAGMVCLYFFIFSAIASLGHKELYHVDPTKVFSWKFYELTYSLFFLGLFALAGIGVWLLFVVVKAGFKPARKQVLIYTILCLLYIVLIKVDLGNYINWFLD